jgi:cytochrome c
MLQRVLVFTRTLGYRHDSIGAGVAALEKLGREDGFIVDQTEDPKRFSDQGLSAYDVVIWLSTSGDVLEADQRAAFRRYVEAGHGWVGIHGAADTAYGWAWYGQLLGGNAWLLNHPEVQSSEVEVEDAGHPSTSPLGERFEWRDEWYNFRANPRGSVQVLLRVNESSYEARDGAMGSDHPIAWCHECCGGRAWYTALGHAAESYADARFAQHLLGGIRWAAGLPAGVLSSGVSPPERRWLS